MHTSILGDGCQAAWIQMAWTPPAILPPFVVDIDIDAMECCEYWHL
jgi:hypothetical protein